MVPGMQTLGSWPDTTTDPRNVPGATQAKLTRAGMDATPRGHCHSPRTRRGARGPEQPARHSLGRLHVPAMRGLVLKSHLQNQLPPEPSAALTHSRHQLAFREAPGRCPCKPARRILGIGGHSGCGSPSAGGPRPAQSSAAPSRGCFRPACLPLAARCELGKHWAFPWAAAQRASVPRRFSLGDRQAPRARCSLAPQESGHSPVATGPAGPHGLRFELLVPWRKQDSLQR